MASSLFNKYPFDLPTEAFSFDLFRQAFAAVQASIVHLQGMPLAKRFALVPLGPPLLQYSSTCKVWLRRVCVCGEVWACVSGVVQGGVLVCVYVQVTRNLITGAGHYHNLLAHVGLEHECVWGTRSSAIYYACRCKRKVWTQYLTIPIRRANGA